jgi:hypothetical protein
VAANTSLECLKQPDNRDATLWRYISIPKLLSFCWDSSLYFCRLTDLQDPFEGRLPKHAIPAVDEEHIRTERLCGRDPSGSPSFARVLTDWTRNSILVNCWCMHEHESEALWRIYGHSDGVAIRTTYSKLAAALPDAFYMGMVRYIDYSRDSPDASNLFNLAMCKRAPFEYEHEVRIVQQTLPRYKSIEAMLGHLPPPFLTQPVPFSAFDAIVLSPYAPPWLYAVVKELVRRYECPLPVERSSMTTIDETG